MPEQQEKEIQEIRANRIILEDLDGNQKVSLDACFKGLTTLSFYDQQHTRLTIGIDPDGKTSISFFNKEGKTAMALGTAPDFGSGLSIHDTEGRPVCFITVSEDGIPHIRLCQVTSQTEGKEFWTTPDPKKA